VEMPIFPYGEKLFSAKNGHFSLRDNFSPLREKKQDPYKAASANS
jgi:hypothetical protein